MIKSIILEFAIFVSFFINSTPGNLGKLIRKIFYKIRFNNLGRNFTSDIGFSTIKPKNISLGHNCSIMKNCSIYACEKSKIFIGNNFNCNLNVYINSCNGGLIKIGNNVAIGPNTVIRAANHIIGNLKNHTAGEIIIEDNVWIGANCVILKDVTIHSGAVIGAGVTVYKDVAENEIIVNLNKILIK
jgi:acetyltransferase-like isoleucine patch superfamily enzyme